LPTDFAAAGNPCVRALRGEEDSSGANGVSGGKSQMNINGAIEPKSSYAYALLGRA